MKTARFFALVTAIAAGTAGTGIHAQDAAAPSLQDLLKTQYKVARVGSDSSGFKILEPGTVVAAKNGGIMATAPGNPHVPKFGITKVCDNTFKNGNLTVGKACASMTVGSHFLPVGDKLFITKFEVKAKENKITFNLIECDSCNRVAKPSFMKVEITFEFAPKFLDTAEPGQVTDVVGQIFAPDAAATRAAAGGQAVLETPSSRQFRMVEVEDSATAAESPRPRVDAEGGAFAQAE